MAASRADCSSADDFGMRMASRSWSKAAVSASTEWMGWGQTFASRIHIGEKCE
jgi:hypothetical protein